MKSFKPSESHPSLVRPMLATYAIPRTGSAQIEGRFSSEHDVWVVDGPSGPQPIIQAYDNIGQTTTVTEVRAEQDDTDICPLMMLGTTTTTKVNAESEDVDISNMGLLEVTTKTFAQLESDDVSATIKAFGPQIGRDYGVRALRIQ